MTDSPNGPPLLRPIPRRPFDLSLREPTPPDEDYLPSSPDHGTTLNLESLNSRLIDRRNNASSESGTISRVQSVMNLTGSTLMGIYSPTTYGKDRFHAVGDEQNTPWGTGAETPATSLNVEDPNYEVQKERTQARRRRSSLHPVARMPPLSTSAFIVYLGSRGFLLSGLGVLYGMLVAQVQDRHAAAAFHMENMVNATNYDWRYMAFWGISGVALGSLLPWFDGIWEGAFGRDEEAVESAAEHTMGGDEASKESGPSTDWALAIRGIGTFVGIAFAIRKLPWDSTLQVSMTLALVNPALWFLLDRSMPGFLVSAFVAIAGSAVLMGLEPDMVPIPSSSSSASSAFGLYGGQHNESSAGGNYMDSPLMLGGLATQETVATGIWMGSVLFCCCVFFGNIGRWLALNRSATGKGRWAERR